MRRSRTILLVFVLTSAGAGWAQEPKETRNSSQPLESFPEPATIGAEANPASRIAIAPKSPNPPKAPKLNFILLGGLAYAAAGMDMHDTEDSINRCKRHYCLGDPEGDPIARPLTHLPAPAYYATGFAMVTGVNWLGWKMGRSARWHKVWWLAQTVAISLNTEGVYSHHH